ncbi:MAG: amidohydrolase [Acidobacteria bacterium]|nr:MAG: amidohydrolase [Acidobacteriota bacterium]
MRLFLCAISLLTAAAAATAQTMSIEEYAPKSTLVVPEHIVTRAKYPFIDVHGHQRAASPDSADQLIRDMDAMNMAVMVNLSGGSGERLKQGIANLKGRYRDRFVVFANLDFSGIDDPNYGKRAAAQLEEDVKSGAQGLKIFKNLGLALRDGSGKRIPVDDPRFDPVWEACARLGIPVLIHTGEPWSFFQPVDKFNERWLELKLHPNRVRPSDQFPAWEALIAEQHRLFQRHPKTTFINAHLGWLGSDLVQLGKLLDKCPNVQTEIGAVLYDLGRQPRFARAWLIRYQDRVMFGKDAWAPSEYPTYFRVLETADEYFDYYRKYHAFWQMYGLDLPDDVLQKLYYKNALRVIPGISRTQFEKSKSD